MSETSTSTGSNILATMLDEPVVELMHHIGGDKSVLAAMLVSTKGEESREELKTNTPSGVEAAEGRIRFLMRNRHGTPFEHNQFCFYVKAPIVVFREFHRHRIGWSYNEESGRYKQLAPVFYVPGGARPLSQQGKPGAYVMVPAPELHGPLVEVLANQYTLAYALYEHLLEQGVAREVARLILPVGIYSSMYATCNARSLMAFLSLRTEDENAAVPSKPMYEIQQVARLMEMEFALKMPITYKAWNDFGRVAP